MNPNQSNKVQDINQPVQNINQPSHNHPNPHHNQKPNQSLPNQTPNYQAQLSYAYNIFIDGNKDYKEYSLHLALDKFEKALEIVNRVYPHIKDDPKLRPTTDQFLKSLNQNINITKFQIKNRFEFKTSAGLASQTDYEQMKNEIKMAVKAPQQPTTQNYSSEQVKYVEKQPKNNNYNKISSSNPQPQNNKAPSNSQPQQANKKDDKAIVGNDLRDKVLSEIIDSKPGIKFSDVIGLDAAKQILKEIIIIPNLRPDLFTGLRSPPRGLLLFGPPGTGKTMIAKAVATECQCTFFNISASSLTSKYVGESEKLVRALFELAFEKQPSVVFIDEVESILSKRSENENEAMKRLKTEFLIQFDGVGSSQSARVLIIGATNRPSDLDPAVIRRLPKSVYIGPFNEAERKGFIKTIVQQNDSVITDEEFDQISKMCNNYSNSDLKELCREAAYEPLREISDVQSLEKVNKLRPICFGDFQKAVKKVRGTLTKEVLQELEIWNQQFGALN